MKWSRNSFATAALSLLVRVGDSYLLGDDSQLCWVDGVITSCAGLEGITVEWVDKPIDAMMTTDEVVVSCTINFDESDASTVVPKKEGAALVNHINIHSCNENVVLCVPSVSPDVATHSPAKNGGSGTYEHTLKLPTAGVWTTICHGRIYSNATGTVRKIDAAVAHFGISVSEPPLPPPDHTPIIAGSSAGAVGMVSIVVGVLVALYIMRKNDIMIKFSDIIFEDASKPWRVTATSSIYKGTYNGLQVAIKKIKTNATAPTSSSKTSTGNHKNTTINLKGSANKVAPGSSKNNTNPKHSTRFTTTVGQNGQNPEKAIKKEMQILNKLKSPRIVQFIGVAIKHSHYFVLTELMTQGSLFEVLGNLSIGLTFDQKLNISEDTVNGLRYMHSLNLLHGDIKSLNVFMDSGMKAKLGDFGSTCKDGSKNRSGTPAWMAPEILDCSSFNTKASDIYAIGIMLWELWIGRPLYSDLDDLDEDEYIETLIEQVIAGKRPEIRITDQLPLEIKDIIKKCWSQDAEKRPDVLSLDSNLHVLSSDNNFLSIHQEKKDEGAASLLYKILPTKIAEQIQRGEKVEPIHKDMITILFTDIVGFTQISSTLQSEEVMDMLSRLYDVFDAITQKYELFKVETIGDAYMVAGGLFDNEDVQAQMICRQGLDMVHAASKVPVHVGKPELGTIKIRVGAHTGPVVASVVGSLNPRFCLFGDTVNHASRMESNSISQRFQISTDTKNRIAVEAPEFDIKLRGKIAIKGKGNLWTYWVEGLNPKDTPLCEIFPPPPDPTQGEKA